MTKMKVAYLRVSSDEQKENETIATQRDSMARFCAANNLTFDRTYEDNGVTGTIPLAKRPAGSALMKGAEAGLISDIWITKLDRLGRNLRLFLNLLHKLERLGITIHPIFEPIPEGNAGKMYMQMMGSVAEMVRDEIVANTMRGHVRKASTGWTGGSANFGYRLEGKLKEARLAVHPVNAEIVRRLFEDYEAGKQEQAMADELNAQGIPTSRQNPKSFWTGAGIHALLVNPIYTGRRQWGRRQRTSTEDDAGNIVTGVRLTPERIIESSVPAIVSKELFDRVQKIIKTRSIMASSHVKESYLLRGKILCGICGLRFMGRKYGYVCTGRHCAKRLHGGRTRVPCKAPIINRAEIEGTVWDILELWLWYPDKAIEELEREMVQAAPDSQNAMAAESAQLARNTSARDKARAMYQDGVSDKAEFARDMKRLDAQRAAIQQNITRMQALTADRESQAKARTNAKSLLEQLRDSVRNGYTPEEKQGIAATLVESITVKPDGECETRFQFHCDAKDWLRGVAAARFPAGPAYEAASSTEAQVRAGVAALKVAAAATLPSVASRYLTLKRVITFPGPKPVTTVKAARLA